MASLFVRVVVKLVRVLRVTRQAPPSRLELEDRGLVRVVKLAERVLVPVVALQPRTAAPVEA